MYDSYIYIYIYIHIVYIYIYICIYTHMLFGECVGILIIKHLQPYITSLICLIGVDDRDDELYEVAPRS